MVYLRRSGVHSRSSYQSSDGTPVLVPSRVRRPMAQNIPSMVESAVGEVLRTPTSIPPITILEGAARRSRRIVLHRPPVSILRSRNTLRIDRHILLGLLSDEPPSVPVVVEEEAAAAEPAIQQPVEPDEETEQVVAVAPSQGEWVESGKLDFRKIR